MFRKRWEHQILHYNCILFCIFHVQLSLISVSDVQHLDELNCFTVRIVYCSGF